ncbi:HD-GYP domain-containing protein [Pontibacillus marinus]|uniref:Chemotaxis protein CheY n=1 Tax=Pontibacillus marinus BH030004 = DSM 16465 TaxID=1385511 RepID=A0A0A5I7I9_9BACI|nr:HD domain-containing phosphohydrolase [Pontibacillus marinus]KGX91802.1 chemotaxis protein CheY [Pontibacillus marinus BH030004 = DSM 16465]
MEQSPENLFSQIAQDNLVLNVFKHHSFRVMYLSTMLAKEVECYDEDMRISALLHDIGKMGLSSEILLKPSRLTDLEMTIVESHSHIGNTIVRKVLGKTRPAKFVRDHHENWDGTGYPRRLEGEEISLQGRIIRICDSFDTMTYDRRVYHKNNLSHQEAIHELRRCKWKQYDGDLVETFISLIEKNNLPEDWYDQYNKEALEEM